MFAILVTVFIVTIIILMCISYKLYNYALNPKASKKGIFNNNYKDKQRKEDIWIYEYDKKEDVYINSFDNLKLHGYQIKNNNNSKWAITVHGYTGKAQSMSAIAYKYYEAGYNLLMPDLRGHGESDGSYIGMGWHDRLDIIKWIEFIIKQDKNAQIVLHGVSMGASTVMMVSGEELKENVKVIIEDCGYTSVMEQLSYKLKTMFKIPSFPVMNFCNLFTKIKCNYSLKEASSISQLKKASAPILFIHGDKDKFVPFYMMEKLYNSCNSPKDKLVIKEAGHAESEKVDNKLYWDKVFNFINNYIK